MIYSQNSIVEKKNRVLGKTYKMSYRVRGLLRYLRGAFFALLFLFVVWQVTRFVEDIVDETEKVQRRDLLSQGEVSVLYDMDGNEIQKISDQDTDQAYVALDQIPKSVRQAYVASIDTQFYNHHGMNVQEIIQNIYQGIFEKKEENSFDTTITKQLLQNRMDNEEESGEKSLSQRIKEQYLAIALEDDMGKDEILELYLNTVNMGGNLLGVQAASRYYFGKDIKDVTISEAAVLAAIAREPVRYHPLKNQSENNAQRKEVLKSMLDMKYISEPEYEDALGDDVYLRMENKKHKNENTTEYSYYTDAVLEQVLNDMKEQLGYSQTQAYNMLYRCGIKIYTCQDTGMQQICDEEISAAGLNKNHKTSFVLIEHGTGEIKAVVGGKKSASGTGDAARLKRQPGTLFDVLSVYTPALDTVGLSLGSVEDDASYLQPDTLAPITHSQDSDYRGLVTLRQSMRQSLSVPAVKTLEKVTIQTGYEYLKRFGITTLVEQKTLTSSEETEDSMESDLQFSMALGKLTEGVTNLEMTAAYGSIANQGIYKAPRFYNKVVDSRGNVLLENKSEGKRIMKDTTAWLLTSALRDKENDLSGRGKEKKIYVSGRYALSSEKIDDWYEGYSPYYTGGIWIGGENSSRDGSSMCAKLLWKKIMERIHSQRKISKGGYKKPVDIVEKEICTKCGNLAVRGLCNKAEGGSVARKEYFAAGTEPGKNCTCHVKFLFCEDSKELACDKCPGDKTYTRILLQKNETTETEDTPNTVVQNVTKELCSVHGKEGEGN